MKKYVALEGGGSFFCEKIEKASCRERLERESESQYRLRSIRYDSSRGPRFITLPASRIKERGDVVFFFFFKKSMSYAEVGFLSLGTLVFSY